MPSKLLIVGSEPVLHDLLAQRLGGSFELAGSARDADQALELARTGADVVLLDADLPPGEAEALIAKLSLVGAAPIVAFAVHGKGSSATAALMMAGARAVVIKPAGPLPLDLDDATGRDLLDTLTRVAAA